MQPSCQNAEVVEAFCRAAASRSNTRRSIQQPRPLLHFTRPAEMPPLHSLRFALASRLPSRTAPTLNPHSARCLAGAQLPAISCLGAFRPPALGVRGETVIPAAENLHTSGLMQRNKMFYSITSSAMASTLVRSSFARRTPDAAAGYRRTEGRPDAMASSSRVGVRYQPIREE